MDDGFCCPSDVSPCSCPEGFPKDRGEVFVLGTKVLVLVLVLENILSGDAFLFSCCVDLIVSFSAGKSVITCFTQGHWI